MSFSYDPTLADDLDKVRFYIADTVSASALFSDEEVTAMLVIGVAPLTTAAMLADTLAARYGRLVSQSIDGASFSYGERANFYMGLATRLRAQAANGDDAAAGTVYVGGISDSEMVSVETDTDRTPSSFKVGQHDDVGG